MAWSIRALALATATTLVMPQDEAEGGPSAPSASASALASHSQLAGRLAECADLQSNCAAFLAAGYDCSFDLTPMVSLKQCSEASRLIV